jgi:NAD(P)-dependent dehydrogenase (short-subunit alcohol dehydrogenase family)
MLHRRNPRNANFIFQIITMTKNIVITGASGNLGKACVERFVGEGYRVIAIVSSGKGLGFEADPSVITYDADLTNENQVNEVFQQIVKDHKTIEAGILLVGGFAAGGIKDTDGASIKKMFSLNFETAYYPARIIFQQMQKQTTGGRIILVGSRPALKASEGKNVLAYALSKSLIFKLAEYLNAEGGSQDIITSVIVPGVIDTPPNRKAMPDADFSKWVAPEAIAETMAFIISANGSSLREPVFKVYGRS